jgi:hypothetical protein
VGRKLLLTIFILVQLPLVFANETYIEQLLDNQDRTSGHRRTAIMVGYGLRNFTDSELEKYNYKAAELGFEIEFMAQKRFSTTTNIKTTIGIKTDQESEFAEYNQRYYNLGVSQSLNVNFDYGTFLIQPFIGFALSYNYYANVLDFKINDEEYEVFEISSGNSYEYFLGLRFIFKTVAPYIVMGVNHFTPSFFEVTNVNGLTETQSAKSYTGANLKNTESSNTEYIMAGISFNF